MMHYIRVPHLLHGPRQLADGDVGLGQRRRRPAISGQPRSNGLARLHQTPDVPGRLGVLPAPVRRPVPAVVRSWRPSRPKCRPQPVHGQHFPGYIRRHGRPLVGGCPGLSAPARRPADVHRAGARRVERTTGRPDEIHARRTRDITAECLVKIDSVKFTRHRPVDRWRRINGLQDNRLAVHYRKIVSRK